MDGRLEGQKVLLTSGFGRDVMCSKTIHKLQSLLTSEGASCTLANMPGHGSNSTETYTLSRAGKAFSREIRNLFEKDGDSVHVVANSLNAKALASSLRSSGGQVQSVTLFAPSYDPLDTVHRMAKKANSHVILPRVMIPAMLAIPSLKKKRDTYLQNRDDGVHIDAKEFYHDLVRGRYRDIDFPPELSMLLVHNYFDPINSFQQSYAAYMKNSQHTNFVAPSRAQGHYIDIDDSCRYGTVGEAVIDHIAKASQNDTLEE